MEAPFAVIGVRTIGERLVPHRNIFRAAQHAQAQNAVCQGSVQAAQAYLKEPNFDFDLPFDYVWYRFPDQGLEGRPLPFRGTVLSYLQ